MNQTLKETLSEIREQGNPAALAELIAYNRFVGMSLSLQNGELRGKLPFDESLVGNPSLRALHGGVIGGALESIALFTLLWEEELSVIPKTITLTVSYLRPALSADTFASARITRRGRRVVSVHAELWQKERQKPVAQAQLQLLAAQKPSPQQ